MKDKIFSVCLLVFCSIMLFATEQFAKTTPFQVVGTAFYPRIIIIIIAFLAFLLLASSFIKQVEKKKYFKKTIYWNTYSKPTLLFIIFGAYVFLLPRIHFIIATLLFMFFGQALLSDIRKPKIIALNCIVTVTATFAIYYSFTTFLHVLFP